ncbi:MAG: SUMF1/EgtB/PvdO family nonheme iron enzyme [Muribaculaceae bacterium]|nr:SUMF1/EgtB/PvdO family nonheme iron enzyme [Muribaculaceae bacterium]
MKPHYFRCLLAVLAVLSVPAVFGMSRVSAPQRGDVTGDGCVDVADVNAIINVLLALGNANTSVNRAACDLTGDGAIDVGDLNNLITLMLEAPKLPRNAHYTVNGVTFEMVAVDGGTFTMGASEDDLDAFEWERPQHRVTLSGYSLGATEVTQELWQAVMGSNPSYFTGNAQRPVDSVSWDDCQSFIAALNALTGLNFRLPTEAEWEFAARGGCRSQGCKYAGSEAVGEVACYSGNSYSLGSGNAAYGTHAVGTKAPNELGLYDMSGNLYEWCADWFANYEATPQANPTGPETGTGRVARGGSWRFNERYCRVAHRIDFWPWNTSSYLGLRLAL